MRQFDATRIEALTEYPPRVGGSRASDASRLALSRPVRWYPGGFAAVFDPLHGAGSPAVHGACRIRVPIATGIRFGGGLRVRVIPRLVTRCRLSVPAVLV